MGRVFTINFNFEERLANAVVCMYEKGYNIFFKVHVVNEELHRILPEGKLEFSFADGLKKPLELKHSKSKELVSCITDRISHYLNKDEQGHPQPNDNHRY